MNVTDFWDTACCIGVVALVIGLWWLAGRVRGNDE